MEKKVLRLWTFLGFKLDLTNMIFVFTNTLQFFTKLVQFRAGYVVCGDAEGQRSSGLCLCVCVCVCVS